MLSGRGERARQAHEEAERWGRTWDPAGARRPKGLARSELGMVALIGLVVLGIVVWWFL